MDTSSLSYPNPLDGDPQAVEQALLSGGQEWQRGDVREAVRWVHRAADAAEAAGDDRRAVGLARTAADLMTALEVPSTPVISDEASALAPYDDFNDQTIVDSPSTLTARAAQQRDRISTGKLRAAPRLMPSSPELPIQRTRAALRVSVTRDARGELVVKALSEGNPAPPGTTEAMLVLLDPEAGF